MVATGYLSRSQVRRLRPVAAAEPYPVVVVVVAAAAAAAAAAALGQEGLAAGDARRAGAGAGRLAVAA